MKKTTLGVNTQVVISVYIHGFTGVLGIITTLLHIATLRHEGHVTKNC